MKTCEFTTVEPYEMYEILQKAKSIKTTVDEWTLKQIPQLIVEIFAHIFNQIIKTSKFPKSLKIVRVLPLRKGDKCKLQPNSYRPISILNPLEKLINWSTSLKVIIWYQYNITGGSRDTMLMAKLLIDKLALD